MKLKDRWHEVSGFPLQDMGISNKTQTQMEIMDSEIIIDSDDIEKWKLRECDREDWRDWMPCYVRSQDIYRTRIYYVNINPKSLVHQRSLVLNVCIGTSARVDEWENTTLISSHSASIDRTGDSPQDEELIQMAGQIAAMGITRKDPFTIDGKVVTSIARK